ncbi:TPA: phage tail tip lysozyme [Enterococcus faecalis]|nr:endolysin [Enterococcus faecalis]
MANIETSINWFKQREGKVSYSMGARMGPSSYDCSSSIYFALIAGGFFPAGKIGNTETLFGDLEANGWQQIARNQAVRGDIFIWGQRGASSGSGGHTGIFLDKNTSISCEYPAGIVSRNYDQALSYTGGMPAVVYHNASNTGGSEPARKALTQPQQHAVNVYQTLKPKGYSLHANASILGNIQVEVGSSMEPDTKEMGGGGYGLVQWTPPSINETGSNYVQRLVKQAGIDGDYRTDKVQALLIDWGMTSGQWIGVVEPATVDRFKKVTDVRSGAIAFLKNFERAGVEKLENRVAYANDWLNFLKEYEKNPLPDYNNPENKQTLKNAGELFEFGIKDKKIFAKGWHFSTGFSGQKIIVMNATNDKELFSIVPDKIEIPKELLEKHKDIEGFSSSGFFLEFEVPDFSVVYLKSQLFSGPQVEELIFPDIISFEQASNAPVDNFAECNEKFFFEIIQNNKVVARGQKLLSDINFSNELMIVPTLNVTLPIDYACYLQAHEEMKFFINNKVFHGIAKNYTYDLDNGTVDVSLDHIISEWEFREVSTNLGVKSRTINNVYNTLDFRYSNQWHIDFLQDSAKRRIDYVYSRQNKLEALTKTCELTEDIFWRVGFRFGRLLEIGKFGEQSPYIISEKPATKHNIQIISDVKVEHDFSDVANMITVYSDKTDGGMSSLSLRDVYNEQASQKKGFPVRYLRRGVNNERGYGYIDLAKIASNQNVEYTVIDEESIAFENNKAIEISRSFNDLSAFSLSDNEISDEDRATAARTVYNNAIKTLLLKRSKYLISFETTQIPNDLNVGDKIRLFFNYKKLILDTCSEYMKELIRLDNNYFVTKIDYKIDGTGREINTITLSKTIIVDRMGVK